MSLRRFTIFILVALLISAFFTIVTLNTKAIKPEISNITNNEFINLITGGGHTVETILESGYGEIEANDNYYTTLPEGYNTLEKIQNALSPYFSKDYTESFIKRIGFIYDNDKLLMSAGDMGIGYIYDSFNITNINISNYTAVINYTAKRIDDSDESGEITLNFDNGKWKIQSWNNLI